MSSVISFISIPYLPNAIADTGTPTKIPSWIKKNAGWWADGSLGDDDFIKGVQYLITNNVMKIPSSTVQSGSDSSKQIPSWIKKNAGWWATDQISDDEFTKGMQYLVSNGIVSTGSTSDKVSPPTKGTWYGEYETFYHMNLKDNGISKFSSDEYGSFTFNVLPDNSIVGKITGHVTATKYTKQGTVITLPQGSVSSFVECKGDGNRDFTSDLQGIYTPSTNEVGLAPKVAGVFWNLNVICIQTQNSNEIMRWNSDESATYLGEWGTEDDATGGLLKLVDGATSEHNSLGGPIETHSLTIIHRNPTPPGTLSAGMSQHGTPISGGSTSDTQTSGGSTSDTQTSGGSTSDTQTSGGSTVGSTTNTNPSIAVTPNLTHIGEQITINVTNFGASETVNVNSDIFHLTIQTDSRGAGSTTFVIPSSVTSEMLYAVYGIDSSGNTAGTTFTIG